MGPLKASFFLLLIVLTNQTPQASNIELASKFGVKYDEALDAIFSIAIRLEALLSDTNLKSSRNFLVSPLSMAVAVGELMLGANGPFLEQLHELLVVNELSHEHKYSVQHQSDNNVTHLSLHQQLGELMQNLQHRRYSDNSYILKTASIMFVQYNINIKTSYVDNILKYYGTQIKRVNFYGKPSTSLAIINAWCKNNTNGVIKELSSAPYPRSTAAILANSVYFKADWEVPFSSEINKRGQFKISSQERVNVTYMIGEFDNYRYTEDINLGCRMVIIPYIKNEISMYIIMPNGYDYNINQFTRDLHNQDLLKLISNARERKVTMVLPKMQLSNSISMLEPLKKYRMYKNKRRTSQNNFNDNVEGLEEKVMNFNMSSNAQNVDFDLSNISEDRRFRMNNIYQQMTLSVNEKGTEAAAISAGIVDYIMDSVVFRVDRPFLFFIRHEDTKAILFWGTIVDPTEEN